MKEKYIITYEDGEHFYAKELTESDYEGAYEGIITIIRITDMTMWNPNEETWDRLQKWTGDGK